MNKIILTLIICFASLVYITSVNFLAEQSLIQEIEEQNQIRMSGGFTEEIGMGDKVSVQVKRPRWYGTILGDYGTSTIENLYLFNLVKLPIKVNDSNWAKYHFGFLFVCLFVFYQFGYKTKSKKIEDIPNEQMMSSNPEDYLKRENSLN